jgi:crooked neck
MGEGVSLLNAWLSFERTHGSEEDVDKVQKQMPRKTKRRRRLEDDTFEEYVDYIFPADDEQKQDLSKMLAMASAWQEGGGTFR